MMNKLIFLLLIAVNFMVGQYSVQFQAPKVPEVYQMDKYGNLPINLYTGRPNINIPLYTIELGDIKIPLEIQYNSNGIRVDEEASRVGLGWYMDMPMITQEVNGFNDFNFVNKMPDYYTNTSPSYVLIPQPDWQNSVSYDQMFSTDMRRINPLVQKADPKDNLNTYFVAMLRSEGLFNYFYYPIGNNVDLLDFNMATSKGGFGGASSSPFDTELDVFNASFLDII